MAELIQAIKEWPVIVQGALGSALFWLVLVLGEKVRKIAESEYSHHSKKSRLSWLTNEQTRLEGVTATTVETQMHAVTFLIYRASRPMLKALMWLVYGLAMDAMLHPVGIVGYLVCISYLFKAYAIVGPVIINGDETERLKTVTAEIEKINEA